MAPPLRIQRPGVRYHVVARGNERKAIFGDDTDRFHFLELLSERMPLCASSWPGSKANCPNDKN